MEVRNRLSQRIWNIRKHRLEIAKSNTGIIRIFRVHRFISLCIGNESHDAPIVFAIVPIRFSRIGKNKRKYLAVDIIRSLFRKFLADMPGNGFNVCLQHFHILEDSVVDTLQYIVGRVGFQSSHFVRVINQSAAQRLDFVNCTLRIEMGYNRLEVIHDIL